MNQTAVEEICLRAERLLGVGDKEAIRQMLSRLQSLLEQGLTVEQGGPVGVDPEVLAAAVKLKIDEYVKYHTASLAIVNDLCTSYRQKFVQSVNSICQEALTARDQESVADEFDIVLHSWLLSAAKMIQYNIEARE